MWQHGLKVVAAHSVSHNPLSRTLGSRASRAPGAVQVPSLHCVSDPVEEVAQSGVDAVLATGGTLLPPADDPGQEPGPPVVHHERPPAVPSAGVLTGLQVTCAVHVVCDHLQETQEGHQGAVGTAASIADPALV